MATTHKYIRILLASDRIKTHTSERSLLKNLGTWCAQSLPTLASRMVSGGHELDSNIVSWQLRGPACSRQAHRDKPVWTWAFTAACTFDITTSIQGIALTVLPTLLCRLGSLTLARNQALRHNHLEVKAVIADAYEQV